MLVTDLETSGGPDDERVYNGGCRTDLSTAQQCTPGWAYVAAGAETPADHAYYLELRDRSGFDLDGQDQIDRDPIAFGAGLSLVYTDEAHGYGNNGVPNPPAQSPLDSTPDPGNEAPDLSDAAFTAAPDRSTFSDAGEGHTDNYTDPGNSSVDPSYPDVANPWRFRYDCLGFEVTSMTGTEEGRTCSDGDLTGDVSFDMGDGCGDVRLRLRAGRARAEHRAHGGRIRDADVGDGRRGRRAQRGGLRRRRDPRRPRLQLGLRQRRHDARTRSARS